jgi:hypothetical protein
MRRKKGFFDNAVSLKYRNLSARVRALKHYGGLNGLKCACCEEKEFSFLSLDHIDGGGNAERTAFFGNRYIGGHHIYRKLRLEGFPTGYQVLCMNCQVGRRDNGGVCPHKRKPLSADELLNEFDNLLRVGSGNFELTQTDVYRATLARVMRKTAASSPENSPPSSIQETQQNSNESDADVSV